MVPASRLKFRQQSSEASSVPGVLHEVTARRQNRGTDGNPQGDGMAGRQTVWRKA